MSASGIGGGPSSSGSEFAGVDLEVSDALPVDVKVEWVDRKPVFVLRGTMDAGQGSTSHTFTARVSVASWARKVKKFDDDQVSDLITGLRHDSSYDVADELKSDFQNVVESIKSEIETQNLVDQVAGKTFSVGQDDQKAQVREVVSGGQYKEVGTKVFNAIAKGYATDLMQKVGVVFEERVSSSTAPAVPSRSATAAAPASPRSPRRGRQARQTFPFIMKIPTDLADWEKQQLDIQKRTFEVRDWDDPSILMFGRADKDYGADQETIDALAHHGHVDEAGYLSNYHPVDITVDRVIYKSVEHYYQASKFPDPSYERTQVMAAVHRIKRER